MSTLLKRIIFIAIILGIAYGIYWLIDRKWADELKQNIVTTTQKTVESLTATGNTDSGEIIDTPKEIVVEKNIVVSDPEIKEPVTTPTPAKTTIPTTTKKTTTTPSSPTKSTTSSSSNVLFDLFK